MIANGLEAFRGKRVLLLQSPVGPFFARLARDLRWVGAQVCKINFNGGDLLFYPSDALNFRGTLDEWPDYLERVITERNIEVVLMFGDCRPLHRVARQLANFRGLEIGVFEEGYIRPHYVTLERYGVNGHSQLPRSPLFYLNRAVVSEPGPVRRIEDAFWSAALWAILYYAASLLLSPWFRGYRHHRRLSLLEALPWCRSFWRKGIYAWRERRVQQQLAGPLAGQYFLVPLQVHNDAQIQIHSGFDTIEKFIHYVVRSFAVQAPDATHLVIKHHPMDRGYHDYGKLIRYLGRIHGLKGRLHYIHDQHLPTLLQHARGVVVVNSTVGMSALYHNAPLKACGAAIYDMPGLTFSGSLKDFWHEASSLTVNRELFRRFRSYLVEHTQLNGSFYKRLNLPGSHAGLVWSRSALPPAAPEVLEDAPLPVVGQHA
ncbi:MAG: capsular biosynthesis protein [Pseudomonadales bacterium]|nr:capsular biosynthesis protein [Pseudomonadales bacterium]